MNGNGEYPRELKPRERELLLWLLPEERPGYRKHRECVEAWKVTGAGVRGEGSHVMSPAVSSRRLQDEPVSPVIAYGVVETTSGAIAVTIRERVENRIEYEIVPLSGGEEALRSEEIRRWTYSTWSPGAPCPACEQPAREVPLGTSGRKVLRLALCPRDERLWVFEGDSGITHILPVTSFYNELMLHKGIRDPQVALDTHRLFSDLASFSDDDMTSAFQMYNQLHRKVDFDKPLALEPARRATWWRKVRGALKRR